MYVFVFLKLLMCFEVAKKSNIRGDVAFYLAIVVSYL
jgi:hypothetical protein